MAIYYLMLEAVPRENNDESKVFAGAFINFWVKSATKKSALMKAKKSIEDENWRFIKTEEIFVCEREFYYDEPDSLECYDEACKNGIASIFYTWPIDEE